MLAKCYRRVGIYEYAKNLFHGFQELARKDDSVTIRYFVAPGYSEEFLLLPPAQGFEPVQADLMRHGSIWRMGLVNYAAARAGADLIFCPAPKILALGGPPAAVTIHDVMASKLPRQMFGTRTARGLRAETWVAAKLCRQILTDSEHSKKDLVELYQLPPEKVSVVYLGYNSRVFNASPPDPAAQQALLARFEISPPYLVHHGTVQLRKNLIRLINAYSQLVQRPSYRGLELVLAGPRGQGSGRILQAAKAIRHGRVAFTGPLPDEELASLVKGAALAVIPSLYEGFCLPMIEAMASGVPTVAADSSCLPEISGGVLRYFDPLSEEAIAAAIADVLEDTDLQKTLIRNGLKRAAEFSWRRCALETLAALTGSQSPARSQKSRACD